MKETILAIDKSLKLLEKYKIPLAKYALVKNENQAKKIANKIGYPVVLKAISPQVIHKTDLGAIVTNIKTEEKIVENYKKIISNVKKKIPKAKIQGVLVQKMIEGGQEVIVGGKKDKQFGQTIAFGLGGVFVEVMEDISFRVVPITRKHAEEMIQEIKGYKVLKGYRGKAYDTNSLIDILLKTSKLLEKNQKIKELDINPVIVLKKGAVAVDARVVVE